MWDTRVWDPSAKHLQFIDAGCASAAAALLGLQDVEPDEPAGGVDRGVGDVGGVAADLGDGGEGAAVGGHLQVEVLGVPAVELAAGTAVVMMLQSLATCTSNSIVFSTAPTPPAPACPTMNDVNAIDEPTATVSVRVVPLEHHLSVSPPNTDPLTALAAVSFELHVALPEVAGRFNARLLLPGGGWVTPPS